MEESTDLPMTALAGKGAPSPILHGSPANRVARNRNGHRYVKKKVMKERTRREKINTSILELKEMIRDSVDLSNGDFSRLEKADILDLVIQTIKSPPPPPLSVTASQVFNFQSGVELCADETIKFLQLYSSATITSKSTDPLTSLHCHVLSERVNDLKQSIISKQPPNEFPASINESNIPRSPSGSYANAVFETTNNNPPTTTDNAPTTTTNGVLLDLSCNSRRNQLPLAGHSSVAAAQQLDASWTMGNHQNQPKRDVLLKIRRKILEKRHALNYRRMPGCPSLMDDDGFMWRPW